MAKLREEQIPKTIYFLKNDFPQLLTEIGGIEDTDEYWEDVAAKCDECCDRYKSPFVMTMIVALMEYLDEQWRKKNERYSKCN